MGGNPQVENAAVRALLSDFVGLAVGLRSIRVKYSDLSFLPHKESMQAELWLCVTC